MRSRFLLESPSMAECLLTGCICCYALNLKEGPGRDAVQARWRCAP